MRTDRCGGYDWTGRFPWIVEAALKNRLVAFALRLGSGATQATQVGKL